ncbi:hypothetical protein CAI21_03445 [Alkalilimnicola ehrlichii]|uniref:Mce/MlaD domain-containing protein n=1 Tax=Alkalilimnicola ehrlichii TaxID=351052 RepID=A0A3E0X2X7_9GAMM|nr:MlaD family protein [Alkalilimnicola ehrlichii]RFA31038.1 hypothetical protein CAI21_03445 [Alkalilimnicola ehrlichii]RFA38991.1 hypothetical protein CAL65_03595 [Alkalilimnicola ehrlichii]
METRINYIAVGFFVLLFGALTIGAALWLGADIATREYQRYSVYFAESVAGLNRNATVTYRGVEVGRVAEMRLIPDRPNTVHVILEIEPNTPLRADSVAVLRMQGFTGIAQVEITGGSRQAPPPRELPSEPYPVIASGPSLLSRMENAMTTSLEALDELTGQISLLFAPENIDAAQQTLSNLEAFTRVLADNRDTLERSLQQTERLLASGTDASEQLTPTLRAAEQALNEIAQTAAVSRSGLDDITQGSLPQMHRTLEEVYALADRLSRLSEELSEQPEMLIFGRPQPEPGPGE